MAFNGSDYLQISRAGTNYKVTGGDVLAYVQANMGTSEYRVADIAARNALAGLTAGDTVMVDNATEKPMGLIQLSTGTVATNRAGVGDNGTGAIVPKQGCALSVSRLAMQALPSAAETFQVVSGFTDSLAAGALTDGAAWIGRWNGAGAEWSQERFAAAAATRDAAGSPAADTNYIWLAVFLNADWSRADYLYSTDSVNWTKAGSRTTGLPSATRQTSWCAAQIIKSVGTTARRIAVDLAGCRVDYVRG